MVPIILSGVFTVLGLAMFEIVNSLDNAVINASVLAGIKDARARRFFVTWGMLLAVGVVRGVLPFVIYYVPNSHLGFKAAMLGFWSGDPQVVDAVTDAAPLLLMAGGLFLVLLFLHWLLVEEKTCGFWYEPFLQKQGGAWFFAIATALLVAVCYLIRLYVTPVSRALDLMLAAVIGIALFFIADGFKAHAEAVEARLTQEPASGSSALSDWSKVLFLEVIDATFSTDGVIGAFAFTMVVPFILIGNGVGAYVVRRLTLSNVDRLCSYSLLKNAALYSVGALGGLMVLEGFGLDVPSWVSPLITFLFVGGFCGSRQWRIITPARRRPCKSKREERIWQQ